jgi:hypothetical protein
VAFVLGILDGLEEFGIAPGAAAIFWRAATADLDQARVEHAWLGIGEIATMRRRLIAALVRTLPRCPCCSAPMTRHLRRKNF